MVNVAGRSKGCNTCRKRKVACDLEKPHCRRCVSSKIACLGYERERVFVHDPRSSTPSGTLAPLESAIAYEKKASKSPTTSKEAYRRQDPIEGKRREPQISIQKQESTEVSKTGNISASSLTTQLLGSYAYRQQLLAEFISNYLPTSPWTTYDRKRPLDAGPWLVLIPSLQDIPPALSSSLLALCTAFVGRRHGNEALVRESMVFHGRALWALQKALWDPKMMHQDETLAACLALCMYEATECPGGSDKAFATHVEGCSKLIKSRGPNAHTSALGHRLFIWFRTSGIVESFVRWRPTYLGDPAWISTPWRSQPKRTIDYLLDNAAVLANIFVKSLTLNPSNPKRLLSVGLDIVNRCWTMEASLRRLYHTIENECDGPLYWPTFDLQMPEGSKPLYPLSFHFASASEAFTCTMYWTITLLLWVTLTQTHRVLGETTVQDLGLAAIESSFDISVLAQNICSSVPYLLQDSMQGLGPTMVATPLIAVIAILESVPGFEGEVEWAKRVMRTLRRRGVRLVGNEE